MQESFATKTKALNEKIEGLQKDLDINRKQYSEKLDKSQKLVEKYRNIAQVSVDRYIKSQAVRLGVSVNEIKNRLNESYTFDDIDVEAFSRCSVDKKVLRHKLLFRMDASGSYELIGNRKAAEIENGNFLYVQANSMRLLRPYLYQGLTIDGWKCEENGTVEMV